MRSNSCTTGRYKVFGVLPSISLPLLLFSPTACAPANVSQCGSLITRWRPQGWGPADWERPLIGWWKASLQNCVCEPQGDVLDKSQENTMQGKLSGCFHTFLHEAPELQLWKSWLWTALVLTFKYKQLNQTLIVWMFHLWNSIYYIRILRTCSHTCALILIWGSLQCLGSTGSPPFYSQVSKKILVPRGRGLNHTCDAFQELNSPSSVQIFIFVLKKTWNYEFPTADEPEVNLILK